jgi:alkanesulfonate monooxygenase SsuD/methylene tetrahydromethanopterin reductase-like flavin-dependent oxidoreductase (luciferase family)
MEFAQQASGSYDTLLAAARWSEERGLACFALPDHYLRSTSEEGVSLAAYDALAILGGLARETRTIRLSVLVSPITFRHPAVLAKNAATIDEMSGGRFSLGVGTGWLDLEHEVFGLPYPPMPERYRMMEEALAYLRAMEKGESFHGDHYTLQARDLNPLPSDGFEIVIGGRGATRTPTLAGRYADEYNAYPAPTAEMERRIALARSEAAAAGRDPDALLVSTAGASLVGTDEADYRRRLEELAAEDGVDPERVEARFEKMGAPHGGADRVRADLARMESIGVTRFYLQNRWVDDLERTAEVFELLGA